ncbi:MAG: 50S ribosomal protein L17 [Chloroflexi bacterium]|jgi:large subunit ribosomal protein L17|nr:50S ribosomal protein L17 [Chloroflexota bacterium]
MRHRVAGKKLGRTTGQRNALRRSLINDLFRYERIQTTDAKARAIRAEAEHMITIAKRALAQSDVARQVAARRLLMARLNNREIVTKVFEEIAPRYEGRPGGYTRRYRLGPRKGDAAPMVQLELVDREEA